MPWEGSVTNPLKRTNGPCLIRRANALRRAPRPGEEPAGKRPVSIASSDPCGHVPGRRPGAAKGVHRLDHNGPCCLEHRSTPVRNHRTASLYRLQTPNVRSFDALQSGAAPPPFVLVERLLLVRRGLAAAHQVGQGRRKHRAGGLEQRKLITAEGLVIGAEDNQCPQ